MSREDRNVSKLRVERSRREIEWTCGAGGGTPKHGNSRGVPAAPVIPVLRASLEGNRAENGTEGIEGKGVGVTKCTLHCEREGSGCVVEGGGCC